MRAHLPAVLAVAAGAAAAVLVIALGPGSSHAEPVPLGRYVSRITLANNRAALGAPELVRLLKWSRRVRACMTSVGSHVGEPRVAGPEILMALPRSKTKAHRLRILQRSYRCAVGAGGPPLHTAFSLERDGNLHLYRPRACLLPVVAEST